MDFFGSRETARVGFVRNIKHMFQGHLEDHLIRGSSCVRVLDVDLEPTNGHAGLQRRD